MPPKTAEDAAKHIIKILFPGTPYPLQSSGAQKVIEYMKLRDEALITTLRKETEEAVAEARREERERIISVTKNSKDAFMSPLTERRWLTVITPPDTK